MSDTMIDETVTEMTQEALIAELCIKVDALVTSHNEIKELLAQITEQVAPAMESLKKSPIMKMLGV